MISFLYFNFIRERLPKNIPFILSEYSFYVLLFICGLYAYTLKQLILPKESNTFFYKIISFLHKPFLVFDTTLKYNKFSYRYYYMSFWFLMEKVIAWDFFERGFVIYFLQLIPRIILLLIFIVDVFWLHYIEIFYYFIFLGIFPLLYNYLKYSLEFALIDYIKILEDKYDFVWVFEEGYGTLNWKHNPKAIYHNTKVSIKQYLELQIETLLTYGDNEEYIEYYGEPYAKENVFDTYREKNKINTELTLKDFNNITKQFDFIMPKLIDLSLFIKANKLTPKYFYITHIKAAIYVGYLICWLYILIISLSSLDNLPFTLKILESLTQYLALQNPFC
jgi:hypothetical protein